VPSDLISSRLLRRITKACQDGRAFALPGDPLQYGHKMRAIGRIVRRLNNSRRGLRRATQW
jgi:hypothetical protein